MGPDYGLSSGGGISGSKSSGISSISSAGSIIGGIAALADAAGSIYDTYTQNQINNKNLIMQKQQQAYQIMLNDQLMRREDNAIQRRVNDLRSAGLSPTLAAGSPASAQPQNAGKALEKNYTPMPAIGAATMGMLQQSANIAQTHAQNKLLESTAQKTKAEIANIAAKTAIEVHDFKNMEKSGVSSNPSTFGKWWNDFMSASNSNIVESIVNKMTNAVNAHSRVGASGSW